MNKHELLPALQIEICPHNFDTFMDEPPSVAQGGRGRGAWTSACKKRFQTPLKFVEHIRNDGLPEFFKE